MPRPWEWQLREPVRGSKATWPCPRRGGAGLGVCVCVWWQSSSHIYMCIEVCAEECHRGPFHAHTHVHTHILPFPHPLQPTHTHTDFELRVGLYDTKVLCWSLRLVLACGRGRGHLACLNIEWVIARIRGRDKVVLPSTALFFLTESIWKTASREKVRTGGLKVLCYVLVRWLQIS